MSGLVAKGYRRGTHRACHPAETLARLRPLLATAGITRVANVTGLDRVGIPVVMSVRPGSRSVAVSQGKGQDLDAARVSAVMESLEAWHAERMEQPLRLASWAELAGDAVDVAALPRPPHSRFTPDLPLLWARGRDLGGGGEAFVPYELVHTRYQRPPPVGSGCFLLSSNGLASGNHLLEAVAHGLFEVIERDATALWEAGGDGTRLRLETVDDEGCRALLERFARAGVRVAAWESTSDVGLPCFICLALEEEPTPWRVVPEGWGMGCHSSRSVALSRALTEAAQARLTVIAGTRDDIRREDYARQLRPEWQRRLRERLDGQAPSRSFRDAPHFETDTVDEDVDLAVSALGRVGCRQVVAVDLSILPGLAVARVVVPGLEGPSEHRSYVAGRRALAARA